MSDHTCHADGCSVAVPPKMFMCRKHWYTLPKAMRDLVWAAYRPGQENDKRPSKIYLDVTAECIAFVKRKQAIPTVESGS